jgi:hypothetical protein
MTKRSKTAILFSAASAVPSGFVIHLLFFIPVVDQVGITIPGILWISVPLLFPILSLLSGHQWPGNLFVGVTLVVSNALVYGLVGYALAAFIWGERTAHYLSKAAHASNGEKNK